MSFSLTNSQTEIAMSIKVSTNNMRLTWTHCCVNISALMEDKQNNRAGCGWVFLGNTLKITQQEGM